MRATEICKNDQRGSRAYTEYFDKGTAPTKTCDCHVEAEVCTVSNKVSGEFCLNREKKIFITRETEKNIKNILSNTFEISLKNFANLPTLDFYQNIRYNADNEYFIGKDLPL